jgi:sugar/nucleoside kinase (ribokinase family)
MSLRNGILAGGNWIVDAVKLIDTWPQQDTLANILAESKGTGGSPFNILLDIALMGARFPLSGLGLVGDDSNGRWILEQCASNGIDTSALQCAVSAPTSYTDVMTVQSTGRRTFFHARGANAELDTHHFDFSQTTARIFHLGYLLLLDRLDRPHPEYGTVAAEVLARAQAAGLKTSIESVSEDSERFERLVLPAMKQVDLCILNEFEAEKVTQKRIRIEDGIDYRELGAAMKMLLAAGVRERVVVHFPEGAGSMGHDGVLARHGSVELPPGYIQGAAGAGDAFSAGVLLAWHEDLPVEEGLRYGVCAAAANLSDKTCTGGLRSLADCLALGEKYGFREAL